MRLEPQGGRRHACAPLEHPANGRTTTNRVAPNSSTIRRRARARRRHISSAPLTVSHGDLYIHRRRLQVPTGPGPNGQTPAKLVFKYIEYSANSQIYPGLISSKYSIVLLMAFISLNSRVVEHRTRLVCLGGETPSPRVRSVRCPAGRLARFTYYLLYLLKDSMSWGISPAVLHTAMHRYGDSELCTKTRTVTFKTRNGKS